MKIKLLALSIISLFMLACTQEEMTPEKLAQQFVEKYEGHKSVFYDADYQIKFFSGDDTVKVNAFVNMVRIPEDTIFGGIIWINTLDSIYRYYDTSQIYVLNEKMEKVTRYKKEETFAIEGNVAGDVIETYFLKPGKLQEAISDSTISVHLQAEDLDGTPTWHWVSLYDDDEMFSNSRKDIWIAQKDLSIIKITYTVDFQGENQYNEWNISNVIFDRVQAEDIQDKFENRSGNSSLEDYEPRSPEERQTLENGTVIPELKGELYRTKDSVELSDYRGKMLLLDFWYMNCFPCIKAIPHLSELHHKYADQGLQVIGVDPFDNNEKDLERMPKFLEKNPLDYPILFVDRDDPKDFKVYAYPTFYLIDRDGRIIFSQVGHGEDTGAKLDSVIQVHL